MSLLTGRLVRLAATDMDEVAPYYYRWGLDPAFHRLTESEPFRPFSLKRLKEINARDWPADDPHNIMFTVRALHNDAIIGFANLDYIDFHHRDTYLGIGLGEKDYHGKGYGADALDLLLDYAFDELDLHRVTLTVFEYNPGAIRLYEQMGFQHEGRTRQDFARNGRRWDLLQMGLLRREWLARRPQNKEKTP